ncbi:MAG: hypothetical protein Q7T71_18235, partial [Herbiconiux sp.]|nr:hypothetical protein [Herbiconiux sp.]
MRSSGGADSAASRVRGATQRDAWRSWLAFGLGVLGLYLTVSATVRLIYRAEGIDPATAQDCDDCDLTIVLDNLGWLALA